ncbi:MAG: oxidoreductase, partial [Deltaproteobacteria bacterium]|nr:oxidoreductase [Deltaproteobacteria bacterium]
FQLRFSPMMMIVQDCIAKKVIGDITDLEVHLNLLTPWDLFPFLKKMSRVEIAVHSIHYLDLIRSFLGNPSGVWAQTLGHPSSKEFAQTRTTAILNYGPDIRCSLSINHNYSKGPNFQSAQITIDGIESAAMIKLGLLLDYPKGEPDEVWIFPKVGTGWKKIDFEGGWFPEAFIGTMSNLQRFASGEDKNLYTSVEDAYHTMSLVESCYISSKKGDTALAR